jgi:hypothetical protein
MAVRARHLSTCLRMDSQRSEVHGGMFQQRPTRWTAPARGNARCSYDRLLRIRAFPGRSFRAIPLRFRWIRPRPRRCSIPFRSCCSIHFWSRSILAPELLFDPLHRGDRARLRGRVPNRRASSRRPLGPGGEGCVARRFVVFQLRLRSGSGCRLTRRGSRVPSQMIPCPRAAHREQGEVLTFCDRYANTLARTHKNTRDPAGGAAWVPAHDGCIRLGR